MSINRELLGTDVTVTSSSPTARLGEKVTIGNTTYMYIRSDATGLTANYACIVTPASNTAAPRVATMMTTTNAGAIPLEVCVPQVAIAANYYGWAAIEGSMSVFVGLSCVQDVRLYTTATAGLVDDTATTLVSGLALETTVGGANIVAACYATRPLMVNV